MPIASRSASRAWSAVTRVITAPNLGTSDWAGFPLVEAVCKRFGRPARMLNDAAVQGLGVVEGPGLECVLTLGTGVGCPLP